MYPNDQSALGSLQSLLGLLPTTPVPVKRSLITQTKHNNLIRNQVPEYERLLCANIKADHIGYINGSPVKVNGHIPDLTATDQSGRQIFCEVETGDTIDSEHTKSQVGAFRKAADDVGGLLHLVVPTESLDYAQQVLRNWNIKVDFWWHG